jgi:hypothetical protein
MRRAKTGRARVLRGVSRVCVGSVASLSLLRSFMPIEIVSCLGDQSPAHSTACRGRCASCPKSRALATLVPPSHQHPSPAFCGSPTFCHVPSSRSPGPPNPPPLRPVPFHPHICVPPLLTSFQDSPPFLVQDFPPH